MEWYSFTSMNVWQKPTIWQCANIVRNYISRVPKHRTLPHVPKRIKQRHMHNYYYYYYADAEHKQNH